MNERVKTRLEKLSIAAKQIITDMECVLSDIEDVTETDDLFVIESAFERTKRNADDAYELTLSAWDLFEEGQNE